MTDQQHFGLSPTEYETAVALERLYNLIARRKLGCGECGRKVTHYAAAPPLRLLCEACGAARGALRLGAHDLREAEVRRFEQSFRDGDEEFLQHDVWQPATASASGSTPKTAAPPAPPAAPAPLAPPAAPAPLAPPAGRAAAPLEASTLEVTLREVIDNQKKLGEMLRRLSATIEGRLQANPLYDPRLVDGSLDDHPPPAAKFPHLKKNPFRDQR